MKNLLVKIQYIRIFDPDLNIDLKLYDQVRSRTEWSPVDPSYPSFSDQNFLLVIIIVHHAVVSGAPYHLLQVWNFIQTHIFLLQANFFIKNPQFQSKRPRFPSNINCSSKYTSTTNNAHLRYASYPKYPTSDTKKCSVSILYSNTKAPLSYRLYRIVYIITNLISNTNI